MGLSRTIDIANNHERRSNEPAFMLFLLSLSTSLIDFFTKGRPDHSLSSACFIKQNLSSCTQILKVKFVIH